MQRFALALLAILVLLPAPGGAGEPPGAKKNAAAPDKRQKVRWRRLFDGQSLGKWKVIDEYDYSRHGKVYVRDGRIVLEAGNPATGIKWTGPFPKSDYELAFEAMRVEGDDFFSAVTFPVGDAAQTLVVGGWGGSIVGLSVIDGEMAAENETCLYQEFDQKRWYRIRLRVTDDRIQAWIDDEEFVNLMYTNRKIDVRIEVEPCIPLGLSCWRTAAAYRNIKLESV